MLEEVQYTQNVKDGVSYRIYLMNLHTKKKWINQYNIWDITMTKVGH